MIFWIILAVIFVLLGTCWIIFDLLDVQERQKNGKNGPWYKKVEWRLTYACVVMGTLCLIFPFSPLAKYNNISCILPFFYILTVILLVVSVGAIFKKLRDRKRN